MGVTMERRRDVSGQGQAMDGQMLNVLMALAAVIVMLALPN
jgi:hypothetical protein